MDLRKSTCSSEDFDCGFGVDLLNFSVHFVYNKFIKSICILIILEKLHLSVIFGNVPIKKRV